MDLAYKNAVGGLGQQVVFRTDESSVSVAGSGGRVFDAEATHFKLVAGAERTTLAGLIDPMLSGAKSDERPLPHPLRARYTAVLMTVLRDPAVHAKLAPCPMLSNPTRGC